MPISISSNTGSGSIVDDSIFSYTYSEEVTSIQPATSSGGSGQVSFSAIELTKDLNGTTHPNSKLMINNTVTLTDSKYGSVSFQAKKVSTAGGAVTVVGDTLQARLNVTETAIAFNGTLGAAITYYCGLVGITPTFDASISTYFSTKTVSFIGWTGNVWDYLKMLCAGVSASNTLNIPFEMYIANSTLNFRAALTATIDISETKTDIGVSVDSFDAAKSIQIYNYNTSYATNKIVYEIGNYDGSIAANKQFLSSVVDNMTVNPGETVTKRFTIDADLISVNQPTCVATISSIPYVGTTGEYVIVGADGLPIQPSQWTGMGGSLLISTTENAKEIEITVTAPAEDKLLNTSQTSSYSYAPYRIGVETSGNNVDYPALWITGTGVFYNRVLNTVSTGASDTIVSQEIGQTIDNPFITNTFDYSCKAVAAAQYYNGPSIELNASIVNSSGFGTTIGSTFTAYSNKYRITNADYTPEGITVKALPCATFADFDAIWPNGASTKFSNFDAIALTSGSPLSFNEFTIIPLTTG